MLGSPERGGSKKGQGVDKRASILIPRKKGKKKGEKETIKATSSCKRFEKNYSELTSRPRIVWIGSRLRKERGKRRKKKPPAKKGRRTAIDKFLSVESVKRHKSRRKTSQYTVRGGR